MTNVGNDGFRYAYEAEARQKRDVEWERIRQQAAEEQKTKEIAEARTEALAQKAREMVAAARVIGSTSLWNEVCLQIRADIEHILSDAWRPR